MSIADAFFNQLGNELWNTTKHDIDCRDEFGNQQEVSDIDTHEELDEINEQADKDNLEGQFENSLQVDN